MNSDDIHTMVVDQIADRWDETNWHSVDLRTALVTPSRTTMILRLIQDGKINDSTVDVWIVLQESPDGYIIFYDDDCSEFGLASKGFPEDRHPVICGYYGDFWTTFKGM